MTEKTEKQNTKLESQRKVANECLGLCGRMISASKGAYRYDNPDNLVFFNANVYTTAGKIWYGDFDITVDEDRLHSLSNKLGEKIYLFTEHGGRSFEPGSQYEELDVELTRSSIAVDGDVTTPNDSYAECIERRNGRLYLKKVESKPLTPKILNEEETLKEFGPKSEYLEIHIDLESLKATKEEIEKFKAEKKKAEENDYFFDNEELQEIAPDNPLSKFYVEVGKKFGHEVGSVSDVLISKEYNDKLKEMAEEWMSTYLGLSGYQLQKNIGYMMFGYAPAMFYSVPFWAETDSVYVKKASKGTENNTDDGEDDET